MKPRRLLLTDRAVSDIEGRAVFLSQERGSKFAMLWAKSLVDWLEKIASAGAQLGTAHPHEGSFRTFGYKKQATILAEFKTSELRIIRVYFAVQDWSR